ncbi:hypothetical protein J437_LFUL003427 [Ladona fulva]|uniref:Integrin beta n=1 Tax=Ladona fulva TaxID=123851 RepID=A0A8K0K2N3_LADFU|nr:hypothetical protein J437_LFUL003427 [Ladona fulva]
MIPQRRIRYPVNQKKPAALVFKPLVVHGAQILWIKRCIPYKSDDISGVAASSYGKERCRDEYFYFPESNLTIVDNRAFRSAPKVGEINQEDAVQIRPQKVKLRLRVREPFSLDLHYALAEGYPVDLYYLMDLSKSMEDDKIKLSKLGDTLVEEMKNLTSNFKIGFGSFVDKRAMPFVDKKG